MKLNRVLSLFGAALVLQGCTIMEMESFSRGMESAGYGPACRVSSDYHDTFRDGGLVMNVDEICNSGEVDFANRTDTPYECQVFYSGNERTVELDPGESTRWEYPRFAGHHNYGFKCESSCRYSNKPRRRSMDGEYGFLSLEMVSQCNTAELTMHNRSPMPLSCEIEYGGRFETLRVAAHDSASMTRPIVGEGKLGYSCKRIE